MVSNPQLELAFEYVSQTNKHIFLTGKAGTGKTTFLRRVRRETTKRLAVVAPTGVAAINAEGVTIHSLFQLPFGTLVPGQVREQMNQRRFSRKKINLIKSLDLLIIDEISMVRADVLDAMDEVLRRYRDYSQPFGGLQLLMIGDLHQLPPVVKQQEWDLLREHYKTPYFFGSLALQQTDAVTIELKHIFRQADSTFIELLNKVRSNRMDTAVLEALNSRYQPDFDPKDEDGYITLTSHNATSQAINAEKLMNIPGKLHHFKADISGDFPSHAYPTEVDLDFKVNAQVMFVKNDLSLDKLYYNGKIGRITRFEKHQIYVRCPGEEEDIQVSLAEWHNLKYTLDEETKEVQEDVIGTFTQYPLKLAWAITIHKSQGLTFERVVIDAQAAFAHGQVYVALSRCKTFEGIVLRTPLVTSSVKTDTVVRDYTAEAQQKEPGPEQLLQAKREYQQGLLRDLFQFKTLKRTFEQVRRLILENEHSLQGSPVAEIETLVATAREKVFTIADKFLPQLEVYLAQAAMPDDNEVLKERLQKAGGYFVQQLKEELLNGIDELQILTDNQAVGKKIREKILELKKVIFLQRACAEVCQEGFNSQIYVRKTVDAELDFQESSPAAPARVKVPKDIAHPELYQLLVQWRSETAEAKDTERYAVLPTRTLLEIVRVLPTSLPSLKKISGIGKYRAEEFGADIIKLVTEYAAKNQLTTDQLILATSKPPKEPKPPKPDTKLVSLELFRSGKNIEEIAKERGFVSSTIQGHLAHFVAQGEVDIYDLVDKQKVEQITGYFATAETEGLTEAKAHFGETFSFGELRMVLQHWKREKEEEK